MSTVESILGILDKWPLWKRIKEAPDRIDALELSVSELKKALEKCPGKACPYCGARAWRLQLQDRNGTRETWGCEECKKTKKVTVPRGR